MFCEARLSLFSSHSHLFHFLRFIFYKENQLVNVGNDAKNDLPIDKMMLVISYIASFNEETTGFHCCCSEASLSPYFLKIQLACPLLSSK